MFLSMFLAVSVASRFNLLNNTCDPSSFEEGVVIDFDTPKGVIKKVLNLDAPKDCCAACASETGCLTWTFRGDKKPSQCKLRSLPPTQRKSKKGATSGSMSSRPSPAPAPAPVPAPAPSPSPPPPPPTPAVTKPNILLLFPDQWRFDWAGFSYRQTASGANRVPLVLPTVAALARRGVRFTQAYVPAPLCAPSRACLAAGRDYDESVASTGVSGNNKDYNIAVPTFYKQLRDTAGYWTMNTGKDDLTKGSSLGFKLKPKYGNCTDCLDGDGKYHLHELGWSDALRFAGKHGVMQQYPKPYEMYGFFLRNKTLPRQDGSGTTDGFQAHHDCLREGWDNSTKDLCDADTYPQPLYQDDFTAASAVTLLRRRNKSQPFFLHVSFPGPHPPFSITGPMNDRVKGMVWPKATDDPKPNGLSDPCPGNHEPNSQHKRCDYAAEILNIDGLFERVMDEVRAQGELNRTIVCMTSDHGEMLGDHGDFDKSKPWQASVGVPLICGGPGLATGKVIKAPVGTVDLAATFLDYAGAKVPAGMTSTSMRSLLDAHAPSPKPRAFVKSGLKTWRMVVQTDPVDGKSYKLICCKGKCPESPSTAPGPTDGYTTMLVCVDDDPYDMKDLSKMQGAPRRIVQRMMPLLPADFSSGCNKSFYNNMMKY